MINLIVGKGYEDIKKTAYTFFYLTEFWNEEIRISNSKMESAINICYGTEPGGSGNIVIPIEKSYGIPLFYQYEKYMYMSFKRDMDVPYHMEEGNLVFNFDIINSSFYMLACMEEIENKKRDGMKRFLAEFSSRRDIIDIPLFDMQSNLLLYAARLIDKNIKLKNKHFEIMLTHDVDSINSRDKYVFLHNAKELVMGKKALLGKRLNNLLLDVIKNRHIQIHNYMELEAKRGARSEFYFIEGTRHRLGKRYELQWIEKELGDLKDNGYVAGIHTNFFSYDDAGKVKYEIKQIEKHTGIAVKSCRNHYLRFEVPDTWRVLKNAGILCDSTLGFSDKNGFRAGTARAFLPFDSINNEIFDLIEVPLVVMDGIIMEKTIPTEQKWESIKHMIDMVSQFNGVSSVLWHQRVIYDNEYKHMYERMLDYIIEKGGEFVLSGDLINRKIEKYKKINALIDFTAN